MARAGWAFPAADLAANATIFHENGPAEARLACNHNRKSDGTKLGEWAEIGGYALPDSVLAKLPPTSISGGSFGPDGLLYLTGHDAPELYVVRIPREGPVLEHIATIPAPLEGQAWAWDRSGGAQKRGDRSERDRAATRTLIGVGLSINPARRCCQAISQQSRSMLN